MTNNDPKLDALIDLVGKSISDINELDAQIKSSKSDTRMKQLVQKINSELVRRCGMLENVFKDFLKADRDTLTLDQRKRLRLIMHTFNKAMGGDNLSKLSDQIQTTFTSEIGKEKTDSKYGVGISTSWSNLIELNDGTIWILQKTSNDGACALHAILGEVVNGLFVYKPKSGEHLDPSTAVRRAFITKLKEKRNNPNVDEVYKRILYSLLRENHRCRRNGDIQKKEGASLFGDSKAGREVFNAIKDMSSFLPKDVEKYLSDDKLFEAYQSAFVNKGYWLIEEEIKLASFLFDKKIRVCSKIESQYYLCDEEPYNPDSSDFILIAHDGDKHYERFLQKKD